ncbi:MULTISPECIES: polysaccharide biosynthesis tyrosine autokinase [Caproicibacterium]|uniref:Polysaccharide chain length determinant N-terminal domain-containing protein n=1 Tax=Caproicibacterium argilliputei TaxID=3030016 RepID=A0AA97H305_9FIRM|nr:polysaccharide biosynthesis tyrosine autokinase [Caproicibacterium argilliputei]WOC33300.1 hypothetical protein PXC00_05380 [Caproicibacterium argilliputei]
MEVSISFSDIWNFVKRNWWKLLIVVVLLAGVGAGMSLKVLSPTYASDSTVVISCTIPENADKDYRLQYTSILASRVNSGLALANATQIKQEVADELNVPVAEILDIKATLNQNAPSIKVTTSTSNASICAKVSDTACEILAKQLKQMFPTPELTVTMVDPGKKAVAVSSKMAAVKGGILGGGFALVVCFVFAVLKVLLDKHLRNSVFAAEALQIPLLGTAGSGKGKPHAEEYRRIRSAALLQAGEGRSLLFAPVSRNSKEGELLTGLARSLAGSKKNVLLLDADMVNPQWAAKIGVQPKASLLAVLNGSASLQDAATPTDTEGLHFLGCAAAPEADSAADLLASQSFADLLAKAEETYDYILVSTPAEESNSAADSVASVCDAVIMVARYGVTPMEQFRTSLSRIRASGGKVIGFVTTDAG